MKNIFSSFFTLSTFALTISVLPGYSQDNCEQPEAIEESRAFLAEDGRVVVEAESGDFDGDWVYYNNAEMHESLESYTGCGFLRFEGNSIKNGSPADPITYRIKITDPGEYKVYMRGLAMSPEANDLSNDCYIKMEGQDGYLGKSTKFFISGKKQFSFRWIEKVDKGGHNFQVPVYDLDVGVHEFVVSGRSKFFVFDRIVIAKKSMSKDVVKALSLEESPRVPLETTSIVMKPSASATPSSLYINHLTGFQIKVKQGIRIDGKK